MRVSVCVCVIIPDIISGSFVRPQRQTLGQPNAIVKLAPVLCAPLSDNNISGTHALRAWLYILTCGSRCCRLVSNGWLEYGFWAGSVSVVVASLWLIISGIGASEWLGAYVYAQINSPQTKSRGVRLFGSPVFRSSVHRTQCAHCVLCDTFYLCHLRAAINQCCTNI